MHLAVLTVLLLVATLACKGFTPTPMPTSPSPPTPPPVTNPPPPGAPPSTASVVIGSNNTFIPLEVTVALGGRVTFTNQSSRSYDIMSDPPLLHTDCPAVMEVGFIQPGQTKQTGSLTVARTCGFHDHFQEHNPDLRGRIIVVQ